MSSSELQKAWEEANEKIGPQTVLFFQFFFSLAGPLFIVYKLSSNPYLSVAAGLAFTLFRMRREIPFLIK